MAEETQIENNADKISVDPKDLHIVDISEIRLNTWNPKDKDTTEYKRVLESIKANGLMGFIVVRENPAEGTKYEIIDGEQRFTACKELGYTKILVNNKGVVDDKKARELTLWWQAQVPFTKISLAKMVDGMIKEYGDIYSYFSRQQISDMQKLAQLNFDGYQKPPKMPAPPTGSLLKNFMVQLSEAQYAVVDQAIVKAKKECKDEGTDISTSRALEFVCADFLTTPDGLPATE